MSTTTGTPDDDRAAGYRIAAKVLGVAAALATRPNVTAVSGHGQIIDVAQERRTLAERRLAARRRALAVVHGDAWNRILSGTDACLMEACFVILGPSVCRGDLGNRATPPPRTWEPSLATIDFMTSQLENALAREFAAWRNGERSGHLRLLDLPAVLVVEASTRAATGGLITENEELRRRLAAASDADELPLVLLAVAFYGCLLEEREMLQAKLDWRSAGRLRRKFTEFAPCSIEATRQAGALISAEIDKGLDSDTPLTPHGMERP